MAEVHMQSADAQSYSGGLTGSMGWNIFIGFLLIILGLLALGSLTVTSLLATIFFGWLFLIAGIAQAVSAIFIPEGRAARALIGLVYASLGLLVILGPALSLSVFTLYLAITWTVSGLVRIFSAVFERDEDSNRVWSIFAGAMTALLGVMVWAGWPVSSLYVIALFIGIDLIIAGLIVAIGGTFRPRLAMY